MTATPRPTKATRPLLGVRRQPGRLALAVFRLPLVFYRVGLGWLLGRTFLLLVHAGRKTGRPHSMTAMVLDHNAETGEVVICSAWGASTDWIRNIRARPALRVQIGRESYVPQHRFLSEEEGFAVAVDFRRRHPYRMRFISRVLGWGDLRSEAVVRAFVATRPFVAFRPASQGDLRLCPAAPIAHTLRREREKSHDDFTAPPQFSPTDRHFLP